MKKGDDISQEDNKLYHQNWMLNIPCSILDIQKIKRGVSVQSANTSLSLITFASSKNHLIPPHSD